MIPNPEKSAISNHPPIAIAPEEQNTPKFDTGLDMASPWRRFWARTLDLWLEVTIASFFGSFVLSIFSEGWVRFVETASTQILGIIFIPVAFILDALIYRLFGNSLGKHLLGLSVTSITLQKLTFPDYLKRNFKVWISGYGLGIPLVYLFTMTRQYRRLKELKPASYDEVTGYGVRFNQEKSKPLWMFISICVALLAIIFYIEISTAPETANKANLPPQTQSSWYVWVNPNSGKKAEIDDAWKYSSQKNEEQQDTYTFINNSKNVVVVFAAESYPGRTLNEYVTLYTQAVRNEMRFNDGGTYSQENGIQIWTGIGTMPTQPNSILKVQVRALGDKFWRVVSVQTQPSSASANVIEKIAYQLWASI
jgi:uncharacterized RDD family membrane protein YckC